MALLDFLGSTADTIGTTVTQITGLDPMTGTLLLGSGIFVAQAATRQKLQIKAGSWMDEIEPLFLISLLTAVLIDYFHYTYGEPTYTAHLAYVLANAIFIGSFASLIGKHVRKLY
jgi:di/tricarboxylate transporter